MFKRIAAACVAAMLSFGFSACGGGSIPPLASLLTACPIPFVGFPTLVTPAAGASGVADGNFTLTLAWNQNPNNPSPWSLSLQPQSGAAVPLVSFALGTTNGTYSVHVPALASPMRYTLIETYSVGSCTASQGSDSFTTQ